MSILSQDDIRRAVDEGHLQFSPTLEEAQWGPASIDLRLGLQFTKLKSADGVRFSVADGLKALGSTGLWITDEYGKDTFDKQKAFTLEPNEFVLATTYESIRIPPHLIALVEGRSTYARVGLSMHQTAPWIQPGWSGPIILEIRNSGPLHIDLCPIKDRPCQITFFELSSKLDENVAYGSKSTDVYQDQRHPIVHSTKSKTTR